MLNYLLNKRFSLRISKKTLKGSEKAAIKGENESIMTGFIGKISTKISRDSNELIDRHRNLWELAKCFNVKNR